MCSARAQPAVRCRAHPCPASPRVLRSGALSLQRWFSVGTAALALGLLAAGSANAELVFLTTGRNLSVRAHRIEGESIVLELRAGGEIVCDRALVARIDPDEVAYPEPAPEAAAPLAGASAPLVLDATPYAAIIDDLSTKHGVDAKLVRALIQVESAYRADARSPKGAMGLMQLMPQTARQYALRNPYDPTSNLDAGIKHLRSLLDRFEIALALAAYNAGEAAVRRFGGIPPYPETRTYVARILQLVGGRSAS